MRLHSAASTTASTRDCKSMIAPGKATSDRDRETRAAAARCDRVRVLDLKTLANQVVDIVDLSAAHELEAERVDQDGRGVFGEHQVIGRGSLLHQLVFVLEARAAAAGND